jgi:hypothetical protein
MRLGALYSHLNGHEWLLVHRPDIWRELEQVIAEIDAEECRTKVSKEEGMRGKMLYSPIELNRRFGDAFAVRDWKEKRTKYWVTDDMHLIRETLHLGSSQQKSAIEAAGKTPILSYNQTDFQKDRVSVELQFGKYAFIAYDLFVKHLAFFIGDIIDVGIEMLPMKAFQSHMSSGPGYYEGALYDLGRQGRGSPAVPLVLVGLEA